MERVDIYLKLVNADPKQVADLTASILDLLAHKIHTDSDSLYTSGWNDSRDSLVLLHRNELAALGIVI